MSEKEDYPSLIDQGKNLVKFSHKLINHIQKVSSSEESLSISDEIYNQRIEVCKTCPKYDKEQHRCKECGCFLEVKAKFIFEECPLQKWQTVEKK